MNRTKWLDFLALLMISLLVVVATAAVYYSLGMTSTVTTATTDVWFVKGVDNATAGVSLSPQNTSATLTDLKAYPNASFTYTDPLRVKNNHTSSTYQIRLNPVLLSGNDTEFVYVRFLLRNGTYEENATLASLNYTCDGADWTIPPATGWVQIPAGTEYAITIITKAKDNAAAAQVQIEIAVDVQ
ncbi:hypothetical protein GTO27_01160 [Candidatus Bathyarchaeota archaeon]|nr:hypothetical protein [Candidatus Bathyarchaeota archaeon]